MQGGKAVAFSSKTLNSLEKMYANIERVASDCLGSEKFHMCRVTVETDHKPQYSIVLKADWIRMMLKLTMTLWCILSQENTGHFRLPWQSTSQWNRTSQWARRCNRIYPFWGIWIRKQHPEEIQWQLKYWRDIKSSDVCFERMALWEYWNFREEAVEKGMSFKSDRIVVPRPLKAEVCKEKEKGKSLCFSRDYVFCMTFDDYPNQRHIQFLSSV